MSRKMTEEELIREAQRKYHANYRENNREKLAKKQREWRKNNPEKVREHQRNHWLKRAKQIQ